MLRIGCIDLTSLRIHPLTGEIIYNNDGMAQDNLHFQLYNNEESPGIWLKCSRGVVEKEGGRQYLFPEVENSDLLKHIHQLDKTLEAETAYIPGVYKYHSLLRINTGTVAPTIRIRLCSSTRFFKTITSPCHDHISYADGDISDLLPRCHLILHVGLSALWQTDFDVTGRHCSKGFSLIASQVLINSELTNREQNKQIMTMYKFQPLRINVVEYQKQCNNVEENSGEEKNEDIIWEDICPLTLL